LDATKQAATVSFTVGGLEPSEVGLWLDERYDLMCRVGLHCAPAAHKTLGTFPSGSVRFGLSAFNTSEEVDTALGALEELACTRR
jgi:selenocysteine lyase/cysteine desulfurase